MRKSRFTDTQIIGMIKEQKAGLPTAELCRQQFTLLRTLRGRSPTVAKVPAHPA